MTFAQVRGLGIPTAAPLGYDLDNKLAPLKKRAGIYL